MAYQQACIINGKNGALAWQRKRNQRISWHGAKAATRQRRHVIAGIKQHARWRSAGENSGAMAAASSGVAALIVAWRITWRSMTRSNVYRMCSLYVI